MPSSNIRQTPVVLVTAVQSDAEALVRVRIEAMQESLECIGRFDPIRARARFLEGFSPVHTRHIDTAEARAGFVIVKPEPGAFLLEHLYIYVRPERNVR